MGEKIAFDNGRLSRARDLDLESDHTAYHHASVIDLYLHTKFHWNRRNFLWTDGHFRHVLLGRLGGVDLINSYHWDNQYITLVCWLSAYEIYDSVVPWIGCSTCAKCSAWSYSRWFSFSIHRQPELPIQHLSYVVNRRQWKRMSSQLICKLLQHRQLALHHLLLWFTLWQTKSCIKYNYIVTINENKLMWQKYT